MVGCLVRTLSPVALVVVYRKAPGTATMLSCTIAVLSWQCAPRHTLPRHSAPQMAASTAPVELAAPLAAPLRWSEEPDNLWTFTGWSESMLTSLANWLSGGLSQRQTTA